MPTSSTHCATTTCRLRFPGSWAARPTSGRSDASRSTPSTSRPAPDFTDATWPIGHAGIAPYYDKAVDYLTAGANVFRAPIDGVDIDDDAVDYTRLERFSRVAAIQVAHAADIERSSLIDVRLNATVVDMTFESGRIASLTVADRDGTRRTLPVKTVALAAGGLESTRQLLALQSKHPHLFGGKDGPLGRYYMGHVIGEVADITFASDALDAAYDFYLDEHGSYGPADG